jgi:tetratricopeptide (TPR) repeat protein
MLGVAVLAGCTKAPDEVADAPSAPPRSGPLEEARRLIDRGDLDAALAALQGVPPGADAKYLEGRILARKAETAPLPTPPPAPVPAPKGYVPPPPPELKAEEVQALERYEEALGLSPNHAGAHRGIADLLAPHALRRLERGRAPAPAAKGRRRGRPEPTPPPVAAADGPDASVDRVIREYKAAADADPSASEPVEALIDFCEKANRPAEGRAALQDLLQRVREKPEPFIRYGDFLRSQRDWDGAIEQYRQALIWRSDDLATQAKIGEIYIGLGEEHFARREYGAADQRYKDAQKWIKDRQSPSWQRLQAAMAQLTQIRRGSR